MAINENTNTNKQGYTYRKMGLGHVGAYQVSGRPFLTGSLTVPDGSEEKISFPYVAKSVKIRTLSDHDIKISFTGLEGSVAGHLNYWVLASDTEEVSFDVKCKEIYVTGAGGGSNKAAYCLYAELTGIPVSEMYHLTGSGITS